MNDVLIASLKKVEFFDTFSSDRLQEISNIATIESFGLGDKLLAPDTIPNKVSFVLDGEIRIIYQDKDEIRTLGKGKLGTPIGIISHLRSQGCEYILASSDINVLTIPDTLFIELYQENIDFRNLCEKTTYPSEVVSTISQCKELNIINVLDFYLNNKNFIELTDNIIDFKNDYIYIIGHNHLKNISIGDIIDKNSLLINQNSIFTSRIFCINKSIVNSSILITNKDNDSDNNNELLTFSQGTYPYQSTIYNNELKSKTYKPINSDDPVDDLMNLLKIICNKLNIPFRYESIYKYSNDQINSGRPIDIDFLAELISMCEVLVGLTKVDTKNINRLPFSIIEYNNKFSIVNRVDQNMIELYSSKSGIKQYSYKKLINEEAKEFNAIIIKKKINTPQNKFGFQWFFPLLKRNRNTLIQIFFSSLVIQIFTLANPLLVQVIIDKVISQRSLDTLTVLGTSLFIVTILEGLLKQARTFIFNDTTNRMDLSVGNEVINHLIRLPVSYFDKRPVGELSTRLAELERIRDFFTGQALTTIIDTLFSLIYIFILLLYSWLLTLISLSVIPLQILITLLGGPIFKHQHRDSTKLNAITQNHLVESISGIQNLKTQNIENHTSNKWQKNYSNYIGKSFQKNILGSVLNESSQLLQKISQLFVLVVGASLVINGKLTLGQLIAFRIISSYVTQPLLRLSTLWQKIEELKISFERLSDIMDRTTEQEDKSNVILMPRINGKVIYSSINFKFNETGKEILNNINIEFEPNSLNGIVGQSGSGKSTLVKLLSRLYVPTSGKVLVDDYDINKVDINSYRGQLGVVMQDPYLFDGTISENISISHKTASSDDIIQAAIDASAHEFIMELENGYDTQVGERGALLSGGQKQRIAIARALLAKPNILILDEATSALDYKSEYFIINKLVDEYKDSTILFVTHRTSSLVLAKKIIHIDKGIVIEQGSYNELMESKRQFYSLTKIKDVKS